MYVLFVAFFGKVWYNSVNAERMVSMYENVRQSKKRRSSIMLYILLAICLAFCAVTAYMVASTLHDDRQFKQFVADLSSSTSYAYKANSATAVLNGKERMLSVEDVSEIYALLANSRGRKMQKRPDTQPEIRVDYGDGSYLEFWTSKLENAGNNRTEGLLVYYQGEDGWSCCYDTDRLDIGRVELLLRKKMDYIKMEE